MLEVRLLGRFEVLVDGYTIELPLRAAQSLLAYLMLTAGTAHRREQLAGLLWPDMTESNAKSNLRHTLWRIRKSLGEREYILADDLTVAFDPTTEYQLDARMIDRKVNAGTPTSEVTRVVQAYGGELLPGFYDEWVVLERERLRAAFESKMGLLLNQLVEAQRWDEVLEWGEHWIAQGQAPEPAYRALMLAYAERGDLSKMAFVYRRCVSALRDELGVKPSGQTRTLYERLSKGERLPGLPAEVALYPSPVLTTVEEAPAPGAPPFMGLRYFGEADAHLFFGREFLTAKLVGRLRTASSSSQDGGQNGSRSLAVIVGASGSGKSSIVRAGLIPALKRGEPLADDTLPPEGSTHWPTYVITPTAHPLEALAASLTRDAESVTATATLMDDLARDQRSLHLFVKKLLETLATPSKDDRVFLVVDQFEELFTLCRDEAERKAFVDNLMFATGASLRGEGFEAREGPTIVVITLRADFYAHCAQYANLREALAKYQEYIGPMSAEELRRAIEEPAKRGGWEFEPGLVDLLLREVGDEPGGLPLLSHALLEIWHRRRGRRLTITGYAESGGVRGAIAKTAESVYQHLMPDQQAIARNIFIRLTEFGEGTQDTRRRAALSELITQFEDAAAVEAVLKTLADARLIITAEDAVEVAHEALIREWPTLRQWLTEDREGLRLHRRLTEAAQIWDELGRDPGDLYRGMRLAQVREWVALHPNDLNEGEKAFLEASNALEQNEATEREAQQRRELEAAQKLAAAETRRATEQTRAARSLRWLAAGLAVFLLAAIGAAALALNQSNIAQNNFVAAERTRLAAQAQIALDNGEGGDLPSLLALRSLQFGYSPEADAALLNALHRGFTRQRYMGHTDAIYDIDFSPDGRTMATASLDATARLWDVQTGQELRRFAPSAVRIVHAVEFSPDGRYLMTGSPGTDGARLWDVQTGQEVRKFIGHNGGPWEIKFSPDGQYVVTGDDEVAHLWDVQTGQQLRQFAGHTGAIPAVAFSPDGHTVATGGADGTVRLWDVATGQQLRQFSLDVDVNWVTFSPDGQYLLVSSGNLAHLWDIRKTSLEIRRFVGHTDLVTWGEFSPDGQYVLTGSKDKTARLWDAATGQELRQFIGHTGGVFPATFSPDGRYVLTGSEDRTARLWDVRPETEPRHISTVGIERGGVGAGSFVTALSPDGQYMLNYATLGEERGKAVAVWNMQTGDPLALRLEATTTLHTTSAFAFPPDNRSLLGGGDDGIVRLWDAQTGRKIHDLPGHSGPVRSVAFSPDGRLILTGGDDQTVRLWDAETGQELHQFLGHTGPVRAVAFSPDGQFVLTGGDDQTARVWNAQTGQELHQFLGHTGPVRAVAFSPDGQLILTGGDDQTARLCESMTGKEVRQFIGHTAQVSQVAFSPDGRYVLTGSADQTARLWDVATGQQLRQFAGHISPVLYTGFLDGGRYVVTGDTQSAIVWRTMLEDATVFTCSQLTRDLTAEERALYHIADNAPTCRKP